MQRVFSFLELPWLTRSSQTTAVMLAMFGGIIGLHRFYLGDRRWGFIYLVFCWTAVPMFIGWYDTVRLARLNSRGFDLKYPLLQVVPLPSTSLHEGRVIHDVVKNRLEEVELEATVLRDAYIAVR